jgi:hypothetical protein
LIGALTLPVAAGGSPIKPLLTAKVTATSIAVVDEGGRRVEELSPTTYRFVVKDQTRTQNFHLMGPSVNLRTKVPAKTTATWSVTLRPGTYTYRSDRNRKLRGTFTVRPGPPPA